MYLFWLCWIFIAAQAFLQLRRAGSTLSLWCMSFSSQWLLLLWSTGSGARGLSTCGSQALEHRLIVVHGLSCFKACGILVPRSRIEPMSPALQGRLLTTGLTHLKSRSFTVDKILKSVSCIPLSICANPSTIFFLSFFNPTFSSFFPISLTHRVAISPCLLGRVPFHSC